ncbi:hypothetical protein [Tepidibacter formicigenes]|jgi:hypothetical protein|uniref:Uncharacterized protein n=1 Tax=Tepidibacter formicigenes DSM 15518 TaxID=1123349 RepID=A0A1M6KS21_9FIRM|nr:hypothetical protein [Tepidibacter formicigenes]SHJ61739.1 hypothetical protein SAMN02744037_00457 [Tepidibacter formicigenes DSM 15518]
MDQFDKISIDQISKRDLLLIIKSLEYTFENTKIDEFINLRNNMIKELCFLADTNEEDFLKYLEK